MYCFSLLYDVCIVQRNTLLYRRWHHYKLLSVVTRNALEKLDTVKNPRHVCMPVNETVCVLLKLILFYNTIIIILCAVKCLLPVCCIST